MESRPACMTLIGGRAACLGRSVLVGIGVVEIVDGVGVVRIVDCVGVVGIVDCVGVVRFVDCVGCTGATAWGLLVA